VNAHAATNDDALLQAAVARAAVTRDADVGAGAIARLPALLARIGVRGRCRIVADSNTFAAAGRRVSAALEGAGVVVEAPIVLDERPRLKPRVRTALDVARRLADRACVPIAVGSGVINDVTKYAAHVAGVPYVCVVTAASMDGYSASGAALLDEGFKRTLDCAPPLAVVADLDVVAAAPPRMAGWGYGDLSGKVVAGLDWMLADALGEDPINPEPFALVQQNVGRWLSPCAGIGRHERDALRSLVDGLLVSGFAMQAHGNSRPASGSDHQFAHLWEMEGLSIDDEPVAHGACVGVGALAMLAMYEWFLAQDVASRARVRVDAPSADPADIEAELRSAFREAFLLERARAETLAKTAAAARRPVRLRALAERWPSLVRRLSDALMPAATLSQRLAAAGCPSHPEELGVTLEALARDYRRARLIRRRYTLLDCLDDLGWLDRAIEAVCGADGFWGRRRADTPQSFGIEGRGWSGGTGST
jgi:glycerol-1-phosphate dehydrogenase [NAD(P)+]